VDEGAFAFCLAVAEGIAEEVGAVLAGAKTAFQSNIPLRNLQPVETLHFN